MLSEQTNALAISIMLVVIFPVVGAVMLLIIVIMFGVLAGQLLRLGLLLN
ncbi:hypothetical protein [Paraglaciecola chathamensis]|nr:hypothetical protein [Paraglaciecola chathamensis]MDO6557783.1 hypothetical protein [Paraglaciecola chathamensis]